jgi:hypothetical protein
MNHSEIVKTIFFINSESSFRLSGDDYSKIEWFSNWDKPTTKELQDALPFAIAAEEAKIANNAINKAAVLKRLGITEEEAQLIIGGSN